jgi:alpha-beta hydrolase superfamily lysophospholipase
MTMRHTIIALLLLCCTLVQAQGSDRAREKRWADEVIPQLVVGDAVWLKHPAGDFIGLYTPGKPGQPAIVIVHGIGVHPDHGFIGPLRTQLADRGFTTLSIQMPIRAADANSKEYYPDLFPEAGERMAIAARFLQDKGHKELVLAAHSLGAWMANVYLDRSDSTPYIAWVSMGVTGRYTTRMLGMDMPMLRINLPVLDIYGSEDSLPGVVPAAIAREASASAVRGGKQVRIAGADHFFARKEDQVVAAIADWLNTRAAWAVRQP